MIKYIAEDEGEEKAVLDCLLSRYYYEIDSVVVFECSWIFLLIHGKLEKEISDCV